MKRLYICSILASIMLVATSCSDFLETIPNDALSPATTWKTEEDAQKFLVGCYDGWETGGVLLYLDCASDIGYNNFAWENWRPLGNGSLVASSPGHSYYDFKMIRRCNTFLENVENVEFADQKKKDNMIGQARAIRAYRYFLMNWWYGGVPIIDSYETAEEARVPRNSEQEVVKFVNDEIDAAIALLYDAPEARGYIAKGAALAIKMRSALYYEDYARAKEAAKSIMNLQQYELDADYANLFNVAGQDSKEIISAVQYIDNLKTLGTIGQMYNNGDGGWSSIVPTQNLVDIYEMNDGLTKEESSGYDPSRPYAGRDPRMAMTVLFPGQDWREGVFNTLDRMIDGNANPNFPTTADNASKTALTWAKYLAPMSQYPNIWKTNACPIVFRYAEVLLSYAEAENELNGPSAEVYELLDQIRGRVGMPAVNRTKYATQATLRELIRRERTVELAGEGLRRADIMRWKDASGKMVAETVLNGVLQRVVGTVDYNEADPYRRAVINVNASAADKQIEDRIFKPHNRYLPIPQKNMDTNPQLVQNEGY